MSLLETGIMETLEKFQLVQVSFQPGTKLDDIERSVILETLKQQQYNRTHAARVLGIGIRTLQRKLKKYGAAGLGLKKAFNA